MTKEPFKLVITPSFIQDLREYKGVPGDKEIFDSLNLTAAEVQRIINALVPLEPAYLLHLLHSFRPDESCETLLKCILYIVYSYRTSPRSWPAPTKGQCATCIFGGKCVAGLVFIQKCRGFVPTSCNHISMKVYVTEDKAYVNFVYDNGFCKIGAAEPVRMTKQEYVDTILRNSSEACVTRNKVNTPSKIIMNGVHPDKEEDYTAYVARVKAIVAELYNRFNPPETEAVKISPQDAIRELFIGLGHAEMLKSVFGNDPIKMAASFFPGKTPAAIMSQFASKKKAIRAVTSADVYKELKKHGSRDA